MNEPKWVSLERLLAEEAEMAVPDDFDVWPNVSRRLHARKLPVLPTPPDTPALKQGSAPPSRPLPHFGGKTRSGELLGNAVSFGLGVVAIVIVAVVVGLTGPGVGPTDSGAGPPDRALPSMASPEQAATQSVVQTPSLPAGANAECTLDLKLAPETDAVRVVIPVELQATGRCEDGSKLQLAILDEHGRRSPIAGNPYTISPSTNTSGRRVVAEVDWRNWCGKPGRFRIESRFGGERHTFPLPEPPVCVDQSRPSTMRPISSDAATVDPVTLDS